MTESLTNHAALKREIAARDRVIGGESVSGVSAGKSQIRIF